MRAAAMSKFGWGHPDGRTRRRHPLAPWQISGRMPDGSRIRDPEHPHAFWLPEDADDDGWIDHVVVFVGSGMDHDVRSRLQRITRIWFGPKRKSSNPENKAKIDEWRLALEGFARPEDFDGASPLLAASRRWRSVTPFLSSGHLKKGGYRTEVLRLLNRRGIALQGVSVDEVRHIPVGGSTRRALNFHRFRSRGREAQYDTAGALLEIEFPYELQGPLALGYASHFGLGLFGAI